MQNLMRQAVLILGIVADISARLIIVSHGIRRLEAYLLVLSFGAIFWRYRLYGTIDFLPIDFMAKDREICSKIGRLH